MGGDNKVEPQKRLLEREEAVGEGCKCSWEKVIRAYISVTNSSTGLIFVKIRAESGRISSKNPGKIRAKIRAKLIFCDYVVFLDALASLDFTLVSK